MKDTLEKIKTLLSIDNKEESKEVKMYAEMILDDGRVIATEDEQFMIGSEVFVVSDDGEASPLSAGTYTMEDGAKMTIDDNSKILDLGEEKEADEVEAEDEEKEEMESEEVDLKKSYAELLKRVEDLEKAISGKEEMSEETEETVEEEVSEDEKVEMSKDMVTSLVEEVEHLRTKLSEIEKEPGAKGFSHNPENQTKSDSPNLAEMTAQERAAYYINNK